MMHLEYKKLDYKGCHIDIQPDHKSDIPRLREMVTNNLNIKNPSKIFSERVKSGEYDDRSEESLEAEAKVVAVGCDVSQQPAALIGDAVSGRGAAEFLPVFLVTAVKENCL